MPEGKTITIDERERILNGIRSRILAIVFALIGIGIVSIYSASGVRAGNFSWDMKYVVSQAEWLVVGIIGMVIISLIDYRKLRKLWPVALILCTGALVAVRIPGIGSQIRGAYRWFRIGGISIQPSEVAKLAMVFVVAAFLSGVQNGKLRFWKEFLPVACMTGLTAGLIAIEPDFGTAALMGAVLTAILIVGGARWWHIGLLCGAFIPPAAAYGLTRFDHIVMRYNAWASGATDGAGWQPWISKVAFGSGGITGMGIGEGHAKLYFLPDSHTDFILAVTGQDFGLVGSFAVVTLFALFVNEGIKLVRFASDRFGALLSFGLVMMIAFQAAFNIAVVTASIPPKGISLPFVSFGGSGLCIALASIGMMISVTRAVKRRNEEKAVDDQENGINDTNRVIGKRWSEVRRKRVTMLLPTHKDIEDAA